ncbi:MAG: hypothetical protein WDO24_19480 [Pseudomonadota bacterium]
MTRVRFLFSEDPLAQDGGNSDQFATWYNLESHYNDYYSIIKRIAAEAERKKRAAKAPGAENPTGRKRHPLDPALLSKLEDFLARADMSNLMRRQAVCAMTPGAQPQAMFRELFISIADLQGTVIPTSTCSPIRGCSSA